MARHWTRAALVKLEDLCKAGKSLREICRVLRGFTENEIIAQARKIGFELKPESEQTATPKPEPRRIRPPNLGTFPPPKNCLWPVGDPKEPDFHYCGQPTETGLPYCSDHCAVAYYRRRSAA